MSSAERSLDRLPQTGPARLICACLEVSPKRVLCRARVPRDSPFRRRARTPGRVSPLIAIEMGAQASALLPVEPDDGTRPSDAADPQPVRGVLAAVSRTELHVRDLDPDQDYLVEVTPLTDRPPLRIVAFSVRCGERPIADGSATTAGTD